MSLAKMFINVCFSSCNSTFVFLIAKKLKIKGNEKLVKEIKVKFKFIMTSALVSAPIR